MAIGLKRKQQQRTYFEGGQVALARLLVQVQSDLTKDTEHGDVRLAGTCWSTKKEILGREKRMTIDT